MATTDTRDITIEATVAQIQDAIADFGALPSWSSAHQSAEVLSTGEDGRPREVLMKIKTAGGSDEQTVEYTWTADSVSWKLLKSSLQRRQDGKYTFVPQGDKTRVHFELTVDPLIPLPGFLLKRIIKGSMETATEGLRKQVLKTI